MGDSDKPARKESTIEILLCLLIGVGPLLPWNAFITAADFFTHVFDTFPFMFVVGIFYNFASCAFLLIIMFFSSKLGTFVQRLIVGFILDIVALILVPIFANFVDPSVAVWLCLICAAATGAATAISFSSAIGMSSLFGSRSVTASMTGNGVSGLIVAVIRVATKAALPANDHGYSVSGIIYFVVAGVFVIVCMVAVLYLNSLPTSQALFRAARMTSPAADDDNAEREREHLLSGDDNDVKVTSESMSALPDEQTLPVIAATPTVQGVLKKIWLQALTIFMVFFVTLSLFPGVVTIIKPQVKKGTFVESDSEGGDSGWSEKKNWLEDWFSVILICIFDIGDFIGRYAPDWFVIGSPKNLWIGAALRAVFYPILCVMGKGLMQQGINYTASIAVFLFAITNGYVGTLGMIFGPANAEPNERDVASSILSFALNFASFCSSAFSLLLLFFINGSVSI